MYTESVKLKLYSCLRLLSYCCAPKTRYKSSEERRFEIKFDDLVQCKLSLLSVHYIKRNLRVKIFVRQNNGAYLKLGSQSFREGYSILLASIKSGRKFAKYTC